MRASLATILIPVYNCSEYTKQCLKSIWQHTSCPCDILVVDNGSTDETSKVLQEAKRSKPANVVAMEVIQNAQNRGVVQAFNQGIDAFQGESLLLLNNDTLVTDCWLERMLRAASVGESVSIVGPMSNTYDGKDHPHPQLIATQYKTIRELEQFALRLRERCVGQLQYASYVFGHCMLITRATIDAVGRFDERYGIGYFEEIDYCTTARKKGYRCAVAMDAFVHHFGNVTLDSLGIDREELKETNKQIFTDKHGVDFNDQL